MFWSLRSLKAFSPSAVLSERSTCRPWSCRADGGARSRALWSAQRRLSVDFTLDTCHQCCSLSVFPPQNVKCGEIRWIYSAGPNIIGEWRQLSYLHVKPLGGSGAQTAAVFLLPPLWSVCLLFCLFSWSVSSHSPAFSFPLICVSYTFFFSPHILPSVWHFLLSDSIFIFLLYFAMFHLFSPPTNSFLLRFNSHLLFLCRISFCFRPFDLTHQFLFCHSSFVLSLKRLSAVPPIESSSTFPFLMLELCCHFLCLSPSMLNFDLSLSSTGPIKSAQHTAHTQLPEQHLTDIWDSKSVTHTLFFAFHGILSSFISSRVFCHFFLLLTCPRAGVQVHVGDRSRAADILRHEPISARPPDLLYLRLRPPAACWRQ